MISIDKLTGNDKLAWDAITSVHTVKNYPSSLWVLIKHHNSKLVTFYDLLEPKRKINVSLTNDAFNRLMQYKVFTDYAINQAEIDEATDNGNEPPQPVKEYLAGIQILEMILKPDEVTNIVDPEAIAGKEKIHPVQLENLMKAAFKDYDAEVFKPYHMEKIWKWYLVIKKWYDALPPFVAEKPEVKAAPNTTE